ncbi:UDP-2,4-diacetamido-2,4,6-trideoxy-beta-L-altropyranose hydrolase [Marinobacter salsuginis]|uniref:UDP-2,4-diacetamido-2,4, 6-trideoxy-beta-L-altropyranose hydrolase n=1 Tax=Marinobacter salsuginis TaxID=418719 RepID=UPI00273D2DD6|nr:UDP-2,4-diacetamido-2,4,6-trideoxy-beta-L-altropyranose hydrolase [Marinobacter salsuginis]
MHIAFRADASIRIGTGHVMRCLTLAEALRSRGHESTFICRNHTGNLANLIEERGFQLHMLNLEAPTQQSTDSKDDSAVAHVEWLGASWQTDAEQTISALKGTKIDWLVVDHYALDARWERRVSVGVKDIMVIDDIADRPHECKVLLDQNLGRNAQDYDGLVPEICIRLVGPNYALLRPEFAEFRERSLERRRMPELKRILITLGGVDRDNVTGQVLSALAQSTLPRETELDVVMGASAPALEAVREQAERLPFQASVSVNVTDMAERMCMADLCIGAAGSTSWERCCLGLPSIMVVLAENQRGIGQALEQSGAAYLLGKEELPESLGRALNELVLSNSALIGLAARAEGICDGLGSFRLVEELSRNQTP